MGILLFNEALNNINYFIEFVTIYVHFSDR